mgnify:CR=1 FL=1
MCLVEIDGRRGTPASCTTPVTPGMQVTTQSPKLEKLRRGVMELYISDHPLDCLTCAANGNCELQDTAGEVGLREVRYGYQGDNHLGMAKDTSNPYFTFDTSKCIVCSRCVRACEEVQGTFALTIEGRGFGSRVAAGFKGSFFDSDCVSCGACVQVCPTATLTENSVIEMGQPRRTVLTTCAYCGVGCSFRAEMQGETVVRMVPDKNGGANEGHSCVKGRFAWGYATHPNLGGALMVGLGCEVFQIDRMKEIGARLVVKTLQEWVAGRLEETPQKELLSRYPRSHSLKPAPKLFPDTGRIDCTKSAREVHNLIRGLSPHPGAFILLGPKKLKIFKSECLSQPLSSNKQSGEVWSTDRSGFFLQCSDAPLSILEVQLEGKKKMPVKEFLLGYRFNPET